MYSVLLLVLVVAGMALAAAGVRKRNAALGAAGVLLIAATLLLFSTLNFWTDLLWFQAAGYERRFWTVLLVQWGAALAGAVLAWLFVYLLTLPIPSSATAGRFWPEALAVFLGGAWGYSNWEAILLFVNGATSGTVDPVFGKDVSFYLFSLPLYQRAFEVLFGLAIIGVFAAAAALFLRLGLVGTVVEVFAPSGRFHDPDEYRALYIAGGVTLLVFAGGTYLDMYGLMYSPLGVVYGPGWTDVHVRLPGYIVLALVASALGISLLVPSTRRRLHYAFARRAPSRRYPGLVTLGGSAILLAALWIVILGIFPALAQWFLVTPNEITMERPYIVNNIRFTRLAFGLDRAEDRMFPITGELNRETLTTNQNLLRNVRLWDYRALEAVYHQFQVFRLYYDFHDVDVDRYEFGGQYRQVMVSAREMNQASLPAQSQTFVNRRFKYTHGYGITMAAVSDFTAEGLPNLLIKDIPPVSQFPELRVQRPEIYYGEMTSSYAVGNSLETEFDYPRGEENVYNRYAGNGGVRLANLWRKFLFGWRFDGSQLFFSTYPTAASRIMFRRTIEERVNTLAPFLKFDRDPYIVLVDGKLHWIVDAYTTSRHFPYSQPYVSSEHTGQDTPQYLDGINYIRNSVKAVVDAYDGTVRFYVFQPDDPLVRTWSRIFPGLFLPASQMPAGLRAHVRYPLDYLLAQGLVYAKYHMEDPVVFYNQEDLWIRATEKYYDRVQAVEPYYVMWQMPDTEHLQFVLMLPFTPKNRQVLMGWVAGLCDGENYGRLITYRFPKETLVIGPQQFETKIDQDAFLSGQLSLWDQHGSRVIRGNVLAIPIEKTVFYVEPIYLQAETAAYPELRLVAVMHGENLAYAETFDQALERLLRGGLERAGAIPKEPAPGQPRQPAVAPGQPAPPPAQAAGLPPAQREVARQARQAFDNYLRLQGEGRFTEAARELEKLRDALQRLNNEATPPAKPR